MQQRQKASGMLQLPKLELDLMKFPPFFQVILGGNEPPNLQELARRRAAAKHAPRHEGEHQHGQRDRVPEQDG